MLTGGYWDEGAVYMGEDMVDAVKAVENSLERDEGMVGTVYNEEL